MRIFADNIVEATWFKSMSPLLTAVPTKIIGSRGTNPAEIDDLIVYDRPDIILEKDASPVLVLEKTREVPTGHNIGQRMARLVRAVERRIPTVKFLPFDARKHGDYTSLCNLNARLLKALERMTVIHGVPALAINWPSDSYGELIDDGTENDRVKAVVHDYVRSKFNPACSEILRQQSLAANEYAQRVARYPKYAEPPGESVAIVDTRDLIRQMTPKALGSSMVGLASRRQSLVYAIVMTPDKCRREDPYTGSQFIYDYIWCRSGPRPEQKDRNLILRFPLISQARWAVANPNDPSRKSSNWYLTANALWFSDGIEVLR